MPLLPNAVNPTGRPGSDPAAAFWSRRDCERVADEPPHRGATALAGFPKIKLLCGRLDPARAARQRTGQRARQRHSQASQRGKQ